MHGKKNIHSIEKGKNNQIYLPIVSKINLIGYKAKK